MKRLGDDEISSIFERISEEDDKNSFAIVCKKFLKVASFHFCWLHIKHPDLLYDILIASPKLVSFGSEEPLSNNQMKRIADSCPNIKSLLLPITQNLDPEVGKLEFNDVGLQAVAGACIQLSYVNLSGRLRFTEIGIGSFVRSCKNLRTLILKDCVNVTDKALKIIAEATCLNSLTLRGCYLISDWGLKYLADGDLKHSLHELFLDKCDRITDNGIVALCELRNIKALSLDYLFNITDISLLEISRKCLNIFWLSLEGCKRITGVGLHAFSGHPRLSGLRLFSCYKVSWEDVESIASTLPRLRFIRLSRSMKKPMPEAGYEHFYINGNSYRIQWK